MPYSLTFLVLSIILGINALQRGGWALALLWPCAAFLLVAIAYLGAGPRVFGKRADGTLPLSRTVVLFPYLAPLWMLWHAARLFSRESCWNRVSRDLYVGRRAFAHEVPDDVSLVLDLTAEFIEPRGVRSARRYVSAPILDAMIASPRAWAEITQRVAHCDGPIYVHCAQGRGRTGMIAAALLMARGEAVDADDALHQLRATRPSIRLNRVQRQFLDQLRVRQSSGDLTS